MRPWMLLAATTLLTACVPEPTETDTDADTDDTDLPAACTEDELAVDLIVYNTRLWYVEDADVRWAYATGAEGAACEQVYYDRWTCQIPRTGAIDFTVSAPGHLDGAASLPDDECREDGVDPLEITLEPDAAPFAETRVYYHQRYADQTECDNSWEVHGTGCYYTAMFCADGYSAIMFSDILNSGVYRVGDASIVNTVVNSTGDIDTETTWTMVSEDELSAFELSWVRDTTDKFDTSNDCP